MVIEFVGSVVKMGDRKIIGIPKCISDNFDKFKDKKVKISISEVE